MGQWPSACQRKQQSEYVHTLCPHTIKLQSCLRGLPERAARSASPRWCEDRAWDRSSSRSTAFARKGCPSPTWCSSSTPGRGPWPWSTWTRGTPYSINITWKPRYRCTIWYRGTYHQIPCFLTRAVFALLLHVSCPKTRPDSYRWVLVLLVWFCRKRLPHRRPVPSASHGEPRSFTWVEATALPCRPLALSLSRILLRQPAIFVLCADFLFFYSFFFLRFGRRFLVRHSSRSFVIPWRES